VTTFGAIVDGFLLHLDARCKIWGVDTPQIERPLIEGALAGMLNDNLITVPRPVYEVYEEKK
jgi:hypothetical protein